MHSPAPTATAPDAKTADLFAKWDKWQANRTVRFEPMGFWALQRAAFEVLLVKARMRASFKTMVFRSRVRADRSAAPKA